MRSAVWELLLAFVSGGLITSVANHYLGGRAERRKVLRGRDHDRIDAIRRSIALYREAVLERANQVKVRRFTGETVHLEQRFAQFPDEETEIDTAVSALSDRRLSRLWVTFRTRSFVLPAVISETGAIPGEHELNLEEAYYDLVERLNHIERRR